jgi:ribosomal protein L37AE/L43A
MGWRFRKSKKLFPGVRLSFGKRGIGLRIGPKNVGVSIGPSGSRLGVSVPGTGISVSQNLSGGKSRPVAMSMHKAKCPSCGKLNQHRGSSVGLILKCKHCGFQYELSKKKTSCVGSGCGCLTLVGVIAFVWMAIIAPMQNLRTELAKKVPDSKKSEAITAVPTAAVPTPTDSPKPDPIEEPAPVVEVPSEPVPPVAEAPKPSRKDAFHKLADVSGKFSVTAKFIAMENDGKTVVLEKENGTTSKVPIEKLSKESKELIDELRKE